MNSQELREILDALGLSQAELARRLGVTSRTVNRWAQDDLPVPQYAVAYLESLNSR
jgi:transcriptional regulator with XRE-family HTH domain